MSAQDKTEQVLRDIHIALSKGEVYDKTANKIIVDKKEMLNLLNQLSVCIYGIMDEYELTKQGRDAAERELRKSTDKIVQDASQKAEDVYAASVLYTDEALHRVQEIMQNAVVSVKEIYDKTSQQLLAEKDTVRRDQSDLKGYLQSLSDTDKYLKLIEERNKQIQKEKEKQEADIPSIAVPKPEIKINTEYFKNAGIPLEDEPLEEEPEEKPIAAEDIEALVKVDLDADYFKWKEESGETVPDGKKAEKQGIFGKLVNREK